ncbi:MAG: tetratricopeptide repeat protein [candidate division Zixibacteria bacterium]|nr:tetratricopeptide repeat protein [candidate division Zixibacteria bacterium]
MTCASKAAAGENGGGVFLRRGNELAAAGKLDSAIIQYNRAIAADSSLVEAYFRKAQACELTGRKPEAVEAYSLYIRIAPAEPAAQIELARKKIAELGEKPRKKPAGEVLVFEFDGRPWVVGYIKQEKSQTLIEYVPAGETIEDWSELISTRYYPGLYKASSAVDVYDVMHKAAMENCAGSHWLPLVQGSMNIIYEWNNEACAEAGAAEYELARIFVSDRGIHRIAYACRSRDTFKAGKNRWMDVLLNAVAGE